MNIIQSLVLCSVLTCFIVAKHGTFGQNKVAGYAAGVSGMPPINVTNCENSELSEDPSLSNALECARTCHSGEEPKTCYYKFVIERYPVNGQACSLCTPNVTNSICADCQCILGDGIERMGLVVNRMMPGPSIQVCLNDFVVVDVLNEIKEDAVTIHWHGVYQKDFQYNDGVPDITQCSILYGKNFRYQYRVRNSGTHFWHAHTGLHKMDGVFGSLIVRDPIEEDPHEDLYNNDLANHVIVINDWFHEESTERYPGRNNGSTGQAPDSFLINGKGRVLNANVTSNNSSFEVITVEANESYRFRLVNAFCSVCPGELTIEGHNLTFIATDGQSTEPVVVDGIVSLPGERYDFIIQTDKQPGAYWIQLRGLSPCDASRVQQLAILQYLNASTEPETPQPSYGGISAEVILNPVNSSCNGTSSNEICISNLRNALPVNSSIERPEADLKYYMPIGFRGSTFEENYRPNNYHSFLIPTANSIVEGTMDDIKFVFPPSPPLSQLEDLPNDQFCNSENLPSDCSGNCSCTHVIKVPLNSVVEVILIDVSAASLNHPFHLHGHAFNVLSMGQPLGPSSSSTTTISVDYVIQLENETNLYRNFDSPPGKDTLALPNNGYAVLRFLANNPGYWLFHCHFIFHHDVGMELVFEVGEQSDLPPVPENFPRCRHFKPPIESGNATYTVEKCKTKKGRKKDKKRPK